MHKRKRALIVTRRMGLGALIWVVLLVGGPQMASSSIPLAELDTVSLSDRDRIDYVTKLGLIQGHLWVAAQLVEAGDTDLGARHAKHPGQEVYQELLPFFTATNSAGFATELEAMSGQFHSGSFSDFRRAYADVMSVIDDIVGAQNLSDPAQIQVAGSLVAQANIEYQAGVSDGVIVDLQEYQDARGFIEIAQELLRKNLPGQDYARGQRNKLLEQLAAVEKLWPSLKPDREISGDGAELKLLAEAFAALSVDQQTAQRTNR